MIDVRSLAGTRVQTTLRQFTVKPQQLLQENPRRLAALVLLNPDAPGYCALATTPEAIPQWNSYRLGFDFGVWIPGVSALWGQAVGGSDDPANSIQIWELFPG